MSLIKCHSNDRIIWRVKIFKISLRIIQLRVIYSYIFLFCNKCLPLSTSVVLWNRENKFHEIFSSFLSIVVWRLFLLNISVQRKKCFKIYFWFYKSCNNIKFEWCVRPGTWEVGDKRWYYVVLSEFHWTKWRIKEKRK